MELCREHLNGGMAIWELNPENNKTTKTI